MGHVQPPTQEHIDNTTAVEIVTIPSRDNNQGQWRQDIFGYQIKKTEKTSNFTTCPDKRIWEIIQPKHT